MIAAIDHKRAIRINSGPFLTFSSAAEKVYIVHRERKLENNICVSYSLPTIWNPSLWDMNR